MNAPAEHAASPAVAEVNGLVERGLQALEEFRALNQEQIDYIVAKSSIAALDKIYINGGKRGFLVEISPIALNTLAAEAVDVAAD